MSKAYDLVHIPLLKIALQRLKMPTGIAKLITKIFTNKTNYIITNIGNTNNYTVHDGIDQGETITPLLWRIYYDPLITKIAERHTGYIFTTHTNS